jgi:hypothetical protein
MMRYRWHREGMRKSSVRDLTLLMSTGNFLYEEGNIAGGQIAYLKILDFHDDVGARSRLAPFER